ncbi:MAG: M16 family metallopeptidase [Crocinitomicaceae bacterium]
MNRKIAPEISAINSVELISPQKIDLGNGIDLFWMNDVPDKTVKLDMVWNAGSKFQNKPLVASFCNQLLLSGNHSISSQSISEQIDSHGGYISHSQHKDHAGLTVFGLTDSIAPIFDIVKSHLLDGAFIDIEVNKLKENRKKEFELSEEKVSVNARKLFTESLFGKQHYYGRLAKAEDFDALLSSDLRAFFKSYYLNTKPTLFLVGNVSEQFIDSIRQFVSIFKNTTTKKAIVIPVQKIQNKYKTKSGSVQSAIRIGKLCMDKTDSDFVTFQVLNTILGGYFGSRLMANIREEKGYTYGIGSGITALKDATYFYISTEVAVDKREDTIKEIYFEMERLQTEKISENELCVVKNYMLGSFLRNSDGAISMMEKHKSLILQDLSELYYTNYIKGVNSTTAEDLIKVAKKHFDRNTFSEISFG